jgi:hypothetical protein
MPEPVAAERELAAGRPLALRLQAALLALDLCTRSVDQEPSSRPSTAWAALLRQAVDAVWQALADLTDRAPASLATVPGWLGPDAPTAGIALLRSRLGSDTEPWAGIADQLRASQRMNLLAAIPDEWADALSGNGSPPPVEEAVADGPTVLRVTLPVVHKATGEGFVIELVGASEASDEVHPADGALPRRTARFEHGMRSGLRAGLALARSFGVPVADTECWESSLEIVDVLGAPPEYTLDDRSAGVPVAVALLRHLLGLADPCHVVTGGINDEGVLEELPPEQLRPKTTAAAEAGSVLLPPPAGTVLADVCARLWPADWHRAVRRTAAVGLGAAGHQVAVIDEVSTNVSATGNPFALISSPTAEDVVKKLRAGLRTIVIGGPTASGRTTSARQAALGWRVSTGGRILELRLADGQLPDPAELRHHIELARLATATPAGTPALVILEDLVPHEKASNLDAVLTTAVGRGDDVVLAICLYTGRRGWLTDQVGTSPSLQRPEQVWNFARQFCAANGLAPQDEGRVRLYCRTAAGDIWFLIHLLMNEAPLPGVHRPSSGFALAATAAALEEEPPESVPGRLAAVPPNSTTILQAYARRVRGGASAAQLQDLRAVAASSLLRVGVPDGMLGEDVKRRLRRVGGTRDRTGRWYIYRSSTCRALLASEHPSAPDAEAEREWKRTADAQYAALSTFLSPYLHSYDPVALKFVTAVLSGAAAVEQRLHRRLLPLVTQTLTQHLGVDAPPALTARALLSGSPLYEHKDRITLLSVLLKAILVKGWASLTVREATTCLRAMRSHRDLPHEAKGVPENLLKNYRDVIATLGRDIRPVIARSDPSQAVLFVAELGQFFEEDTAKHLVPLAVLATNRCDPELVEHHDATVSLVDAALKYGSELRSATLERFAAAPGVRRLIDRPQPADAGLILARSALAHLVDVRTDADSAYHQQVGLQVARALPHSRPRSVAGGLSVFRKVDVWAARNVVRHACMSTWLRTTLSAEDIPGVTPWVSAELIRSVGGISVPTLLDALYEPDGVTAHAATMDALAASIVRMGDLKGVGHVLSAVAAVDVLWGPGGPRSASSELCSRVVGFVDLALNTELRGSVVLKVMEALLDAQVSPDDLRSFLDQCALVVGAEVEDNDKDSAPRLALMLGAHAEVGTQFLQTVQPMIDDHLLLHRMTRSYSIQARAVYLQLACALNRTRDPEFVDRFMSDDWLIASMEDLRFGSVLSTLEALQAYDHVLRDAGVEFRTDALVLEVHDDPVEWARRLKRLQNPSQMTQALHLLRRLARDFALRCLRALNRLHEPGSRINARLRPVPLRPAVPPQTQPRSGAPAPPSPRTVAEIAQRKRHEQNRAHHDLPGMLRLVQRQFVNPGQAVELVHGVQAVDDAGGCWLGTELARSDNWKHRARALTETENPVLLGGLLRMTASSGLHLPGDLLQKLHRSWLPPASRLRSPNAVQSLLRGFVAAGAGDSSAGQRWAAALDPGRLGSRLARGLPADLAWTPQLLLALHVWGPLGSARRVAEELPLTAMSRMEPMAAVDLMSALETVDPTLSAAHAPAAVGLVIAQAQRPYVVRADQHWGALAWLVRALGGSTGDSAADALILDGARDVRHPAVRAWAVGCLGRPVEEDLFAESDPEVLTSWTATARCARLVVRSDLGATDDAVAVEIDQIIEALSPRWRIELLRCAFRDPLLRRGLGEKDLEYLGEEAADALSLGRPVGIVLQEAVDAVATTT